MKFFALFALGLLAGGMITVQSIFNSALGKRVGYFGTMITISVISFVIILTVIAIFPHTANLRQLPGSSEWYLYLSGVMGVVIVLAPIVLIPHLGATSMITALVVGQLLLALVVDQFGLFASPKIEITIPRLIGAAFLVLGTLLVVQE
jgi:transporter family-2 protein